MNTTRRKIARFLGDERGSIALEYALTGMVSGSATVVSMSMIRKAMDDVLARTEFMIESVLINS